ncbi:MAG: hypothetical protein R3C68_19570 [Myxococcota bacterium]
MRQLKIAVKDGDEPKAQHLIPEIRSHAPEDSFDEITGIAWQPSLKRIPTASLSRARPVPWFCLGVIFGVVAGIGITQQLLARGLYQRGWWSGSARMAGYVQKLLRY